MIFRSVISNLLRDRWAVLRSKWLVFNYTLKLGSLHCKNNYFHSEVTMSNEFIAGTAVFNKIAITPGLGFFEEKTFAFQIESVC